MGLRTCLYFTQVEEGVEGTEISEAKYQVVTVKPGSEKASAVKEPKKPKKDLPPKDLKIWELKQRVRELEMEKKQWEIKEKNFTKKLEKAKEFTSKATQVICEFDEICHY